MKINSASQLAFEFLEIDAMKQLLADSKRVIDIENKTRIEAGQDKYGLPETENDGDELFREILNGLGYKPELKGSEFYTVKHPNPYYYLIQPSVEQCAAKIRINEDFSCSIFNRAKDGEHVYLLGKHEFFRFVKFNGVIRALYWNKEKHIAFEAGFHLGRDMYFSPSAFKEEFNRLVRLMIFVEIGDVEIIVLEKGRNNGKNKKDGKITNASNNTVYIVDSSWNQLIIRTEGFAVVGHFRLQPCGVNHADRKLIWIDAFEKHGYKRRPRAEIITA